LAHLFSSKKEKLNQSLTTSLPLTESIALAAKDLEGIPSVAKVAKITDICTSKEFNDLFKSLEKTLNEEPPFKDKFAIILCNYKHAITICYDQKDKYKWKIVDSNFLPVRLVEDGKIGEYICDSFDFITRTAAAFSLRIYTTGPKKKS
jgi:hypothetical protein